MYLKTGIFLGELQKEMTDTELAKIMQISRVQLWRAKKGECVGERFIRGFKIAFPAASIDNYFYI